MTAHTAIEVYEDRWFPQRIVGRFASLAPFIQSLEARRLALVFAIVYFAQGLSHLPDLSITFLLKDHFGFSAAQTAALFSIMTLPWLIKPIYGLISDFVPIFGPQAEELLSADLWACGGHGTHPRHDELLQRRLAYRVRHPHGARPGI